MRPIVIIYISALVSISIILGTSSNWKNNLYRYDAAGYHLYLPALFIYQDIEELTFYKYVDSTYRPTGDGKEYGIFTTQTGKKVNKYSAGIALHELPFFLIAHYINTWFLSYPQDGYSIPYQYATKISVLFWCCIGLILLMKVLNSLYTKRVVSLTLLCIVFGTNLFYAISYEGTMPHAYSFFLMSWIVHSTFLLYQKKSVQHIYFIAIALGLLTITRPSNLVFIIVPTLWGIYNIQTFKERLLFFKKNILRLIIGGIFFIVALSPQLIYWKLTTSNFIHFSYQNEGFIWTEPEIIKGLFSFQKGWFIYTPMAVFCIWGMFYLNRINKGLLIPIVLFFVANIYIIFSWWNWWYGASFSCRALVESFSILSIPLGAFIQNIISKKIHVQIIVSVLLVSLIALNILQTYQYTRGIIHWDRMTYEAYKKTFMKLTPSEEFNEYYMPANEYYDMLGYRYNAVNGR